MAEEIIVYYITGRQLGPLTVPDRWCEECDLTVRAVQTALGAVDPAAELSFATRPWLRHVFSALRRGGWHPPVIVIGGRVFSQGVVPEHEGLVRALRGLLDSRRRNVAAVTARNTS